MWDLDLVTLPGHPCFGALCGKTLHAMQSGMNGLCGRIAFVACAGYVAIGCRWAHIRRRGLLQLWESCRTE